MYPKTVFINVWVKLRRKSEQISDLKAKHNKRTVTKCEQVHKKWAIEKGTSYGRIKTTIGGF